MTTTKVTMGTAAVAALLLAASGMASSALALTAIDRAGAIDMRVVSTTQGRDVVLDGGQRVLVNRHQNPMTMKRLGANGVYTDILPGQFPRDDRHGCVAADFGRPGGGLPDGRIDLFCTLGSCSGRGPAACNGRVFNREYWLGRADGTFVDEGPRSGADRPVDRGRDLEVINADGDGLPDLVTVAEGNGGTGAQASVNRLFLNRGGRFVEQTGSPIRRAAGSECVTSFPGAGGRSDVLVCADPDAAGGARILTYRNDGGGRFTDITATRPYRGAVALDLETDDVTGDGRQDLIVTGGGSVSVWANVDGAFPRRTFTRAVAVAVDSVACDVDRDGDRDIYVATGRAGTRNAPDALLLNDGRGGFTAFAGLPQATAGAGDEATCVPGYPGGTAVTVANGRFTVSGPRQFIRFTR